MSSLVLISALDLKKNSHSPELVQDQSRDFSVYVLDPLESQSAPALVNISVNSSSTTRPNVSETGNHDPQASGQPKGVAVGLGLMSWALLADEQEAIGVTGTVLNFRTTQEALEVIFALREVRLFIHSVDKK